MSTPAQTFDLDAFKNAMLSEHNTRRAQHHAPALALDDTLNAEAQAWAQHMSSTGQFQHDANRGSSGESLYFSNLPLPSEPPMTQEMIELYRQHYPDFEPPTDLTGPSLAARAANAWYEEVANYDYGTTLSINSHPIGHFTQMVWKGSSTLGCGAAWQMTNNNTRVVVHVVCRYHSAGNVTVMAPGQSHDQARLASYGDNVLMP